MQNLLNPPQHYSKQQTRVEDIEVMKARRLLTQQKTPSELGNLRHPLDIPLPKLRSSSSNKKEENEDR